jgi:hypothetical protein
MTPEAIYQALCSVDPALEPWQKCEHEWKGAGIDERDHRFMHYCRKCKTGAASTSEDMSTTFGDGKPRYNSVDELLALCGRLKLVWHVISDSDNAGVWIFTQSSEAHVSASLTSESTEDQVKNAVLGLQEAILRAMGKWTEVEA